ncbi:LpxL/LpxP family Kdo(2)-lipid IV(A) lauroyl/palmitoleoyl acyltransferase [Alteromonas sp. CYL-A6]|uniref:LpxL/LpxP family Kdo(2)-lipid IV(A) lauroyl/palmitoleoyl acyltransferase n=1 Tax=Alteromonas nitratireducens TaxID=3390813 RepID=UPI0034AE85A6
MANAIKAPTFKLAFLHPRYWGIWFGALILYLITWLPLRLIRALGAGAGRLIVKLAPKRAHTAKRNLELCYPDMDEASRKALLDENVRRTGMALFETAAGWWWPAWRMKRHFHVEGTEHLEAALAKGKGVFGMALHNMNVEFACRGLGYFYPSIAFYRKHNNPLLDYLQYYGRLGANKYLIDKRNSKALLEAMEEGELCLYLPDQDYGRKQSIFVPFGGVKDAATTTATMMFIRRTEAVPMMLTSQYTKNGYKVKFYPPIEEIRDMDDETALTFLNETILDIVNEQPESYLWMHKRFKTRPDPDSPSLYK